ncbi:hypothetical protein DBR00_08640 [Pseudomonas sp. HMWF032]|uniref:hypothetical protein n=1 Tax=unclassified Pseudomonas TaxID=196821 RepID=UPI000D3C8A76|nr:MULTISPECIES: hypothetical protein [unclassified Pseudomonas]PTS85811.1 hypothetical protein DBR00_08640 [Pseudomonas sp. HMWF032]PTT80804.1 hypothetical protein DBR41_18795 [Pseudomonas sp. HMWF010]WAC45276.1 hypothetical protein OU997_03525 [Pseudomonas sp. SL4(2022)]
MNVMIKPINNPATGRSWQVCMGKQSVTFRSEGEAQQFVSILQARLNAPHSLPATQLRATG